VKPLSWNIYVAAAALVFAGSGCAGVKLHGRQRNADFARRIESIKQDAHEQLKIGRKKDDVARFYTEHKIPFEVVSWPFKDGESEVTGTEAIGTLYTNGGCPPFGCGSDRALIGVRVRVDADGAVIGKPDVVSMYTDCL
jgi:hypothetical protein